MREYLLYVELENDLLYLGTYTRSEFAWEDVMDYYKDMYPKKTFCVFCKEDF